MRLKEIQRTAHQAWSPAEHHPIYLALGTSAQQLDASFNTTAAIEIFEMDFSDPSLDMQLKGSLPTANRLHSIVWVNFGMGADGTGGRLVGGSENGTLTVYNPEAIMSSGAEAIVGQSEKHTGPVRALDFNPFQSNLLASGANDSEIYIWDLNNFSSPMTPGAKTQPAEDVSVISWNRQVQHILASANPSGKAVVWDLRKNEPIIKISDHSNRMHCSGMLWHPDVATQLVLASEDDRLPVIQMWDLRFATSPLKVLENHTRGILSISWSQADSELLLSSAKDNRILCWNPNTGEVIYELPTTNQWCFDVQWCPRNPALLSTASFDGRITVYSVMGGSLKAQQQSTADKISSSFDSMDPFGTGQVLPPLQVPQPTMQDTIVPPLKKPPKWVRRPVGASFAFGGKLITFENPKLPPVQSPQSVPRQVFVSQVTTETEFLQRSRELQMALQSGSFNNYCQAKIQNAKSDLSCLKLICILFLKVNFEDEARIKFLRLLGFSKDELERKVFILPFIRSNEAAAVADARTSGSVSPADFFSRTPKESANFQIPVSCDTDGLISQALLVGNFEGAVDLCLNDGRYAEAILLSISGGEELLKKTQQKYLSTHKNNISMLISSVVTQNWRDIVHSCELDNWKEALAALLTYAHPEDFARLCDTLGGRLECEGTEKRCLQACLCYICSGNIEKLVECWALHRDCSSPLGLEDLVEKVMMLRKSIERLRNSEVAVQSPILAEKLTCYAGILAAEGSLSTAMSYLPENSDQPGLMMLRDRLFHAQGEAAAAAAQQPPNSFNRVNVSTAKLTPAAPTSAPKAQIMVQIYIQHNESLIYLCKIVLHEKCCYFLSNFCFSYNLGPQEGWNDPPAVRGGPRKKKVRLCILLPKHFKPCNFVSHTHHSPCDGIPSGGSSVSRSHPSSSRSPSGAQRTGWCPIRSCCLNSQQERTWHRHVTTSYLCVCVSQLLQQLPAERVEQKEIPAEHMVLKSTFDSLVQRCQLAAGDPQTKRKLDDAAKRLGHLYDKLREQSLSPNILNGLHEISRCVASQNYQRGLEVHTQVVSSSNFSEISTFMPILKVVMTIANKLGV
uniref:Protein transport protein Sec31A n=1 Tax=Amphiprion ocellaris TaxID=80972 RepID=A0AAQ5XJN2_AMPOC